MAEERKKVRYVGVKDLNDLVERIKWELIQKNVDVTENELEDGGKRYAITQGNLLVGEIIIPQTDFEFMDNTTIDNWFTEIKEES